MIKRILTRIRREFYLSDQEKILKNWYSDKGDEVLRMEYELDCNSVVFDLGGYKGQWSSDIYSRYNSTIYVFEPVPYFAENIEKRFIKNDKINVFAFGVAEKTYSTQIELNNDGSSIFKKYKKNSESIEIKLKNILDIIEENDIDYIDLIKINIEGTEYSLLEYMLEKKIIHKIKNIQIQFHSFVPDAELRMKNIQNQLLETHSCTYKYNFVWENWELNNIDE